MLVTPEHGPLAPPPIVTAFFASFVLRGQRHLDGAGARSAFFWTRY